MGLYHLISFGIEDADGHSKRFPFYMSASADDTDIAAAVAAIAPALDAVIDGKITDCRLTKSLSLPGGLKASAVAGCDVEKGANLSFNAQDTNKRYTVFVPTWEDAGLTGDAVKTDGVYATFQAAIIAGNGTDKPGTDTNANALLTYVTGEETFRK